jgi:hypothetical protein
MIAGELRSLSMFLAVVAIDSWQDNELRTL